MHSLERRLIAKTISYRITSSIITAILVYIFTGKLAISLAIGGLEFFLKSIWYYFHEKIWAKIAWGKKFKA